MAIGADFKMYLLRQFCSNRVKFLYDTQETQTQKWWTRILKFKFCDFWEFFEIFKKASAPRHAVTLWLVWTIMVAAKLDHCRVLVTKFCQNRSALKGKSASERHTDRQTDIQTDRQTQLKIRSLQVCNRANNVRQQMDRRISEFSLKERKRGAEHKELLWIKLVTLVLLPRWSKTTDWHRMDMRNLKMTGSNACSNGGRRNLTKDTSKENVVKWHEKCWSDGDPLHTSS